MVDDDEDRRDGSKAVKNEIRVHGNVNLDNPGEVAWYVYTLEEEDQQVIFHTEEESEARKKKWIKYWEDYFVR